MSLNWLSSRVGVAVAVSDLPSAHPGSVGEEKDAKPRKKSRAAIRLVSKQCGVKGLSFTHLCGSPNAREMRYSRRECQMPRVPKKEIAINPISICG